LAGGPLRHLAHQRRVRVDADHQRVWAPPGSSIGESAIAGTEVNVGFRKRASALSQSSTVYPALASSTNDKHSATVALVGPTGQSHGVIDLRRSPVPKAPSGQSRRSLIDLPEDEEVLLRQELLLAYEAKTRGLGFSHGGRARQLSSLRCPIHRGRVDQHH